jgi:hypothetical protein
MIHFKLVEHKVRKVEIVEVWDGNKFIATITPADDDAPGFHMGGFRVISRYVEPREIPTLLGQAKAWQFQRKPN